MFIFVIWRLGNAYWLTINFPIFLTWFKIVLAVYAAWLIISIYFIIRYREVYFDPVKTISRKFDCVPLGGLETLAEDVKTVAQDLEISVPKLLTTERIESDIFCIGKDKDSSAVVVSQNLIEKLSLEELLAMLAHELYHVKTFVRTKTSDRIAEQFFFKHTNLLAFGLVLPIGLFAAFFDLSVLRYAFFEYGYDYLYFWHYLAPFVALLSAAVFAVVAMLLAWVKEKAPITYSNELSEFLADAYARVFLGSAKALLSGTQKLGQLAALKLASLVDEKYPTTHFMKDYEPQFGARWQEVVFGNKIAGYGYSVKREALGFVDMLFSRPVRIKILKDFHVSWGLLLLCRGVKPYFTWQNVFAVNDVKRKSLRKVLDHITRHQESFNIDECSKKLAIPRFHVFLILCMLMANKVIEVEE
jgi:hypothetical protein